MVKRSTIGGILGAIALGFIALTIIRNPSDIISSLSIAPSFSSSVISPALDFSEPLPFKSIAQQRAEFDFGLVDVTIGSVGLRQSTGGGIGAISGGDINREISRRLSAFRAQGINATLGPNNTFIIKDVPTRTFSPQLTTV